MFNLRNSPVIALAALAAGISVWFTTTFVGLSINVDTNKVGGTLAILMFVALLIERAAEVYIEPQSNPRSAALKTELAAIRAKKDELLKSVPQATLESPAVTLPAELMQLTQTEALRAQELAGIDKETQAKALGITIPIGLMVSVAGVRTIGGLLPATAVASSTNAIGIDAATGILYLDYYQYGLLAVVDVLLTAGLLAGGADGIHKVLDRFLKLAANKPT